jgi:hypothetical protein
MRGSGCWRSGGGTRIWSNRYPKRRVPVLSSSRKRKRQVASQLNLLIHRLNSNRKRKRGLLLRLEGRVAELTGDSIMEDKRKLTVTEPVAGAESDPYAPRKLTLAENAILTVKVLGMLGVIGAAIWGFNLWTSAQ